jgi:histidinol-phosphate phosphatase family protein
MDGKTPVSVVVLTKNEEAVIAECLGSVGWADEVILVDDLSSDSTLEIARKYTDKVFSRKMDIEGRQRNWAYAQAKHEWVLSLDADEQVTPELSREIAGAIKNPEFVAYAIPLRNFIGGYWVRYGGWYPACKVRLFQKNKFRYEEAEVHPRVFIDGACGQLRCDIIHKGYPDLEHFLASINRQSTLEAKKWVNSKRKMSLGRVIWRSVDRFFRRYLRKKGYKDGLYGFVIAYFDSLYQILSYLKYREMLRDGSLQRFTAGENRPSTQSLQRFNRGREPSLTAVFLDRDGVINQYPGDFQYVKSWEEFSFLPGAEQALATLYKNGFKLFVVSNQAGVSKGIYTQTQLDKITRNMLVSLGGPYISGVYYCIHRDEDNCQCRKPKAGLVHQAITDTQAKGVVIDLKESFFVGDTIRDIQTGKSAGLRTILVFSGKEKPENKKTWPEQPDFTARDLSEAVGIILKACR